MAYKKRKKRETKEQRERRRKERKKIPTAKELNRFWAFD